MNRTPPDQALAAGGLYEVCIAVADIEEAARYWRAYGFRTTEEGRLAAADAEALYGHRSDLRAARLGHGDSDHGLVRLWQWDAPRNAGLGTRALRAEGNRWTGQFVRSLLTVANHAEAALAAGTECQLSGPYFIDMSRAYAHLFGGATPEPFVTPIIAVREYQVFLPQARQVFLERFGYDSPLLGSFDDTALIRATQLTQASLLIRTDDPDVFGFYERVLGLWRSLDIEVPYEQTQAARVVFEIPPGETHWNVDLDEPRSEPGLAGRRSGRLKCFRFGRNSPMPVVHDEASPGALGLSAYTWRVKDVRAAAQRARAEGAREVTPVRRDEFGREAIGLRSPDGYFWTFIAA